MKDLTQGNESKLILQFAWPMLLGNVFQQLYNVADSIIVGQFIGKEALAAVGASFPVIFTLIALVIGISMGFTIIISQYFGAKDYAKVTSTIDTMNIFLLIASVILTAVGILFSGPLFRLLGVPADVMQDAVTYLDIYLAGFILMFGYYGVAAVLRGLGDSITPLVFLIVSTILNIILDLIFILVFNWGIAGAAYATIISQGVAFIASVIYLNRYHKLVKIRFIRVKFDREVFRQSVRIGLPSGLQQTFVALGMMAVLGIVNEFGTDVLAAFSVATRIDSFASLPAMNFAAALSSFVGQNIGAGKTDRVIRGYHATLKLTSIITIVMSLFIIIFPHFLMAAFTSDPKVIDIGVDYLYIVGAFYLLFTTMFINTGLLRGAGDTLIPMFITLFSLWIVRIPLAWLLSKYFDYHGIWWSIPIAWFFGMSLSWLYYRMGRWKTKSVVKQGPPPSE
jgi:putative MATE family efflux protein